MDSGHRVNQAFVRRKFAFLSGEISSPVVSERLSARQRVEKGCEKSAAGIVVKRRSVTDRTWRRPKLEEQGGVSMARKRYPDSGTANPAHIVATISGSVIGSLA